MTKFVLIMFLCSYIPGNECKQFEPEYNDFKDYHECARHGYDSAADLMNNFSDGFVDEYRAYIIFSCNEESSVWQHL